MNDLEQIRTDHLAHPGGFAENAWPWFVGFFGVLMIMLYRESLRLMMWARSLNW